MISNNPFWAFLLTVKLLNCKYKLSLSFVFVALPKKIFFFTMRISNKKVPHKLLRKNCHAIYNLLLPRLPFPPTPHPEKKNNTLPSNASKTDYLSWDLGNYLSGFVYFQIAKTFKGKYEAKLDFSEGSKKKSLTWGEGYFRNKRFIENYVFNQ